MIIGGVLFAILVCFYKQTVSEFKFNQIEWTQKEHLLSLFSEKLPLIIRNIPPASFWTHTDIKLRDCFNSIPVFKNISLVEWIDNSSCLSICPWTNTIAEHIASISGISIWSTKWIQPHIPYHYWLFPRYYCWAGNIGLQKTTAVWTCLFSVDSEIIVSIIPQSFQEYLPVNWKGSFPALLTSKDTPFISELNYIDIILRPGSCIFIPAHWFVAWVASSTSEKCAMTCTIQYHSPISVLF
jgi:hypothetical protein